MKNDLSHFLEPLGQIDVYLLDQLMKGRYLPGATILDAGCGHGRNLELLIRAGYTIAGIDLDEEKIAYCKNRFPECADSFQLGDLAKLPYPDASFDHLISSAVLHFAHSEAQFKTWFAEQVRVLKKEGSLFIRMTSRFGLPPQRAIALGEGRFYLSDDSERFLISRSLLNEMLVQHQLLLLEPLKTVNVNDLRAMAVIVLQKA